MPPSNLSMGNSANNAISIDSDSEPDDDAKDSTYTAPGTSGSRRKSSGSSRANSNKLAVPGPSASPISGRAGTNGGSRGKSINSAGNSSGGQESPDRDPESQSGDKRQKSESGSGSGRVKTEKEKTKSKGKEKARSSLPSALKEDPDRPRSRSETQREERRKNVIEFIDSDDDEPPRSKAQILTFPRSKPTPSPSPVKPTITPSPSKAMDHIPHAESSRAHDPSSSTPGSGSGSGSGLTSPSLAFLPGTHALGPITKKRSADDTHGRGEGKKRMSMVDRPHISMSSDVPDVPPAQDGMGGSSSVGNRMEGDDTADDGNAGASSMSFPPLPTQTQAPNQPPSFTQSPPQNPTSGHHKRLSPSSPGIGRDARPKSGPSAVRRRFIPSATPPSSRASPSGPHPGPSSIAGPAQQSSSIVRNGVTDPILFPQSSSGKAGPSTGRSHPYTSEGDDIYVDIPFPSTIEAGRHSDPLDSIPRPGPSQPWSRPALPDADPSFDADMEPEFDFADIDIGPDTIINDLDPTYEAYEGEGRRVLSPDMDLDDILPLLEQNNEGDYDMQSSPVIRPSNLTEAQVEEAIVDATHGVDEVEITDADIGPEPSSPAKEDEIPPRPELGRVAGKVRDDFAAMTRADILAFIDRDGSDSEGEKERKRAKAEEGEKAKPQRLTKGKKKMDGDGSSSVDEVEFTISSTWDIPTSEAGPSRTRAASIPSSPQSAAGDDHQLEFKGTQGVPGPEHPPPGYRGTVRRYLETSVEDEFNRKRPDLTHHPELHRKMFEDWMSTHSTGADCHAKEIRVINETGEGGGAAPEMEYQYGNEMMYHPDVPDPDTGSGCGCVGPCDPNDRSCRCVRRQELYFYATMLTGFAYHDDGTVKNLSVPVWECGPNCGCPPSCMNRIIQRGRSPDTELDLFKTKNKGWGIKARYAIPVGTFLGVYSGEMIPDYESERRGYLYNQIKRTYLFDCDGWQIRNPPDLDQLRIVDPRLADLAEQSVRRFKAVAERAGENEMDYYSAYSVDAFHYGFTRYFNHSCDPNLAITQHTSELVMFTRRPIAAGEEMCISYMGIPDDDDIPVVPIPAPKPAKRGSKSKRKSKTSATAHVAIAATAQITDANSSCKCQAWNCKGSMFSIDVRETE